MHHEKIEYGQPINIPEDAICIQTLDITFNLYGRMYFNLVYLAPMLEEIKTIPKPVLPDKELLGAVWT